MKNLIKEGRELTESFTQKLNESHHNPEVLKLFNTIINSLERASHANKLDFKKYSTNKKLASIIKLLMHLPSGTNTDLS